jgi:hypothetical protein
MPNVAMLSVVAPYSVSPYGTVYSYLASDKGSVQEVYGHPPVFGPQGEVLDFGASNALNIGELFQVEGRVFSTILGSML